MEDALVELENLVLRLEGNILLDGDRTVDQLLEPRRVAAAQFLLVLDEKFGAQSLVYDFPDIGDLTRPARAGLHRVALCQPFVHAPVLGRIVGEFLEDLLLVLRAGGLPLV